MNFCIVGAGAWGTAMATHLDKLSHTVTLVPRRFDQARTLASARRNLDYLPQIETSNSLQIGHVIAPSLMEAEALIVASPTKGVRDWAEQIKENLHHARNLRLVISLAKGLEQKTLLRPTEILRQILPQYQHSVLTGPTNALEVAQGKPTAMVLAGENPSKLQPVQQALSGSNLRVYLGDDIVGAELGAALKNIYAIAAGCSDGLGLGDNAKAALLTRALAEMVRVGHQLGGKTSTFFGLSGFGDLVATSHGLWSRNREFGHNLGVGSPVATLLANRKTVVEGYWTTHAMHHLSQQKSIQTPILDEIYNILYNQKDPSQTILDLMTRELKPEQM